MPSFEWDQTRNAYVKHCVTCEEVFVGSEMQPASELIFARSFGLGGRSNLDGLHTTCNLCRNGMINGYKISHKEKKALYEKQGGLCEICQRPLEYDKARIDHCHTSGLVRGLLHTQCNSQLGFYENHKERIKAYLGEINEDH